MEERLTGKSNPLLRHVKKLQQNRKYRYETGSFLADGAKLVEEALRWGTVQAVFVRDGVDFPAPPELRTIRVPESVMKELSRMETPQGVLALCSMPTPRPLQVQRGMLILDGIQDPGNLGTMIRTADALGVPLLLSDGCADPYNEKTVRASMGAVFRSPPQMAASEQILSACAAAGIPLLVTALSERAKDIRTLELPSYAVVIGSEGSGVSPTYRSAAEAEAIIPMQPHCESMNAAVAAAIVMWELSQAGIG